MAAGSCGRRGRPAPARPEVQSTPDLKQFSFLVLENLIDLIDMLSRGASSCFSARTTSSSPTSLSLTILSKASLAVRRASDRDPGVFGFVPGQLDVFLAPLLGELGQRHSDGGAVVGRIDPDRSCGSTSMLAIEDLS